MKTCLHILFLLLTVHACPPVLLAQDDLQIIGDRLRQELIEMPFEELILEFRDQHKLRQFREAGGNVNELINEWLDDQQGDGTFASMDYANRRLSNWPLKAHTGRTAIMASLWANPESDWYHNERLRDAVIAAHTYWADEDIQNPNWYPNIITIPENMAAIQLLMGDEISEEMQQKGIQIIRRAKAGGKGANLAEIATNQIAAGVLANEPELVADAYEKLAAAIEISTGEGIQPDYSYHYHGAQLYNGGYGAVHTKEFNRLAWLSSGTRFQFPQAKLQTLAHYILDGHRWMVYKNKYDYAVIGRSITIPDTSTFRVYAHLIPGIRYLTEMEITGPDELSSLYQEMQGGDHALAGNRYFWESDFMVHRRPDYYTSVRMFSGDVANAELTNSEGYKTHLTASGMNLIMRTGDEYEGIFPAWDWRRVPGVTAEERETLEGNPRMSGKNNIAGGVTDGKNGAAAFQFHRGTLSGKKAWFFFDEGWVCLGTDITTTTDTAVTTTINQSHLKGDITKNLQEDPAWVHHDGIGYFFLQPMNVTAEGKTQTGSWHEINTNLSETELSTDVFSLTVHHEQGVTSGTYAYFVMPNVTVDEMSEMAKELPVEIIANNGNTQAVWHRDKEMMQAVFWEESKLTLSSGHSISSDKPLLCIARIEGYELYPATLAFFRVLAQDQEISNARIAWGFDEGETNRHVRSAATRGQPIRLH